MGAFFSNIQIRATENGAGETRRRLIAFLEKRFAERGLVPSTDGDAEQAVAVGPSGPWIALYDRETELSGDNELCMASSKALNADCVQVAVYDSDILSLELFRDGRAVDSYSSRPDYFDPELAEEKKAQSKGHPELWKDFLPAGTEPAMLREALDAEDLFADDTLLRVAAVIGWEKRACATGFAYLGQRPIEGLTRLFFAPKERPAVPKPVEGPPSFELSSYPSATEKSVGESVETIVGFRSAGGEGRGVVVWLHGPALENGSVTVERCVLERIIDLRKNIRETFEAPFAVEKAAGGETIRTARFPDFEIAAAETKLDPLRMFAYLVRLVGRFEAAGQVSFQFAVAPSQNPGSGFTATEISASIEPPVAYKPLGCPENPPAQLAGALNGYLRQLNARNVLFGELAYEHDDAPSPEAVRAAFERWFALTGKGGFVTFFRCEDLRKQSKMESFPAAAFIDSGSWRKAIERVMNLASLSVTIQPQSGESPDYPDPHSPSSGFAVNNASFFFDRSPDDFNRTIRFWHHAAEGKSESLADELKVLIDELFRPLVRAQAVLHLYGKSTGGGTPDYAALYAGVRGDLNIMARDKAYYRKKIRAAGQTLWLNGELLRLVDRAALERLGRVESVGSGVRAELADLEQMNDWERALERVLPGREEQK